MVNQWGAEGRPPDQTLPHPKHPLLLARTTSIGALEAVFEYSRIWVSPLARRLRPPGRETFRRLFDSAKARERQGGVRGQDDVALPKEETAHDLPAEPRNSRVVVFDVYQE